MNCAQHLRGGRHRPGVADSREIGGDVHVCEAKIKTQPRNTRRTPRKIDSFLGGGLPKALEPYRRIQTYFKPLRSCRPLWFAFLPGDGMTPPAAQLQCHQV